MTRRVAFIQEFQGRSYDVSSLSNDHDMAGVDVGAADLNNNHSIDSPEELSALFDQIDRIDNDGNRNSLAVTAPLTALRRAAAASSQAQSPYHDIALARTFPTRIVHPLAKGSPQRQQVLALQYALDRLGLLHSRIDGSFGSGTQAAVRQFQSAHGLTANGQVDHATLSAIDAIVSVEQLTPAEAAKNPWTMLNDFSSLTPLHPFSGSPIDWNNASVQQAYRRFVSEYWPIMRQNRLEMDCKTVSLLLVNQFQAMVQQQLGVKLPMPRSADHSHVLPDAPWSTTTNDHPGGGFTRVDAALATGHTIRPEYPAVSRVEALDPTATMMFGVNLRNSGITANTVAQVAQHVSEGTDNKGVKAQPEIDIQQLQVGDMLLLNHNQLPKDAPAGTVDKTFDHCVTVVGVTRNDAGHVTQIVLAVGSYDDITDNDSTTEPADAGSINPYMEELTINFNAQGKVASSATTWSSEPQGRMAPRYTPQNTIMDLHPGASIFAGRWGS